jgi:hypothetical protein
MNHFHSSHTFGAVPTLDADAPDAIAVVRDAANKIKWLSQCLSAQRYKLPDEPLRKLATNLEGFEVVVASKIAEDLEDTVDELGTAQ